MVLENDTFVAKIQVPVGTPLDYGFQIRKSRDRTTINKWVWDGDYHLIPTTDAVIELKATVTLAQK
jgi:hypothetical protein